MGNALTSYLWDLCSTRREIEKEKLEEHRDTPVPSYCCGYADRGTKIRSGDEDEEDSDESLIDQEIRRDRPIVSRFTFEKFK